MKKLLLILPILFSSACSSATYVSECLNKENNYINKDLIEAYNKEKIVYIDEEKSTTCAQSRRCRSLIESDRWNNIEIYLSPRYNDFPKEAGLYSVSRDYTLKNCIEHLSDFSKNRFERKNRRFCLSAKKIEKPTANIIFKSRQVSTVKSNSIITKGNIKLFVYKELFIDKYSVASDSRYTQQVCEKNDLSEAIIGKDF